jgi:hypothetical protein
MKKYLYFLLSLTIFAISCKKSDDNSNNPVKTKTQLLTQSPWKNSVVLRRSNTTDPWVSANTPPCSFDDITTFSTALTYSIDNGPTKCNSGEPQIVETGNWNFTANETHVNYNRDFGAGGTQLQDWTIEQLDENTFVYTFYFPAGPYYKITMTH